MRHAIVLCLCLGTAACAQQGGDALPEVLTPPGLELARGDALAGPLLTVGPLAAVLGLRAATGLPEGAKGRWVCSPSGAGHGSDCTMVAVVAQGAPAVTSRSAVP